MYVYDSINTVYVRLCTLMTFVMSFTVLDSHKPNSDYTPGIGRNVGEEMLYMATANDLWLRHGTGMDS